MAKRNFKTPTPLVDEDTMELNTTEVVEENVTESEVEAPVEKKVITGIVVGCDSLYVRRSPAKKESNVICKIKKSTKVIIDEAKSTKDWYKVSIENVAEGFCMKQFIKIEP